MTKLSMCVAFAAVSVFVVPPASAQVTDVDVTGGKISGVVANGIVSFKGILFAAPNAMHFDAKSSARPVPNMTQIRALDAYFAWRREEAKAQK